MGEQFPLFHSAQGMTIRFARIVQLAVNHRGTEPQRKGMPYKIPTFPLLCASVPLWLTASSIPLQVATAI